MTKVYRKSNVFVSKETDNTYLVKIFDVQSKTFLNLAQANNEQAAKRYADVYAKNYANMSSFMRGRMFV